MSGSPKRIELRAFDTPLTNQFVEVKRAGIVGKEAIVAVVDREEQIGKRVVIEAGEDGRETVYGQAG